MCAGRGVPGDARLPGHGRWVEARGGKGGQGEAREGKGSRREARKDEGEEGVTLVVVVFPETPCHVVPCACDMYLRMM